MPKGFPPKHPGGRPIKGESGADAVIVLRLPREQKGRWVQAARPGTLAEFLRAAVEEKIARES